MQLDIQKKIIGQPLEKDTSALVRPLVSIIMPAYNSSATIVESINSVQSQSIVDIELLVVDNCSSDNTRELVKDIVEYDPRIRLLSCSDKGAFQARNYGIKVAKGKYIAFLDSDDLWISDKLEKQLNFMSQNNVLISCTAYQPFISTNRNKCNLSIRSVPNIIDYRSLLYTCKVGCSTVIFEAEYFPNIQFPNIHKEDYALWLNIAKNGLHIYGLNEVLVLYRVSGSSLSGNKYIEFMRQWSIYRLHLNMSFIRSIYYMFFYTTNAFLKRL